MSISTVATAKTVSGFIATTGVVAAVTFVQSYIPFFLGGLSLFVYMIGNNEIRPRVSSGIVVIGGALLIGYLSIGFMTPLAELLNYLLFSLVPERVTTHVPSMNSGTVVDTLVRFLSFIAGALSRTLYIRLFKGRDNIVDAAIKTIKQKSERGGKE